MAKSKTSLPQGQARCRPCRGQAKQGDGPSCGTRAKYLAGCRCTRCRARVTEQARVFREQYKARHGVSYRTLYKTKPEEYGDRHRRRDAARRARKAGATIESFTHQEIFERDAWTCGICNTPVDQTLSYPDPMSSSLDHVVPLARGGEHSRGNTRLAHLNCNVRRGTAVDEDFAA